MYAIRSYYAQVKDKLAYLLESAGYRFFQNPQLGASSHRIGIKQPLADFGLQDEVGHLLSRAIVHLARQTLALVLLGIDDTHDGSYNFV